MMGSLCPQAGGARTTVTELFVGRVTKFLKLQVPKQKVSSQTIIKSPNDEILHTSHPSYVQFSGSHHRSSTQSGSRQSQPQVKLQVA